MMTPRPNRLSSQYFSWEVMEQSNKAGKVCLTSALRRLGGPRAAGTSGEKVKSEARDEDNCSGRERALATCLNPL